MHPLRGSCFKFFSVAPSVRLVGGSGSHEGRVEILLHGEWGTVCDDDWDLIDANVVCKQLGYSNGASAIHGSAQFGQGTGIIWFDNVKCTGSEAHLYDCPNDGVGIHNCDHSKDAGVTCKFNNDINILYTVKNFRLLQPYLGHLSCIPFLCVTCTVQEVLTI